MHDQSVHEAKVRMAKAARNLADRVEAERAAQLQRRHVRGNDAFELQGKIVQPARFEDQVLDQVGIDAPVRRLRIYRIVAAGNVSAAKLKSLRQECNELTAIFVTILKRSKGL